MNERNGQVLSEEDVSNILENGEEVLTQEQKQALQQQLGGRTLAVCYGAGVDSTAMLVALRAAGLVPAVITFANLNSEKALTMEHFGRMNAVMRRWGWPPIVEVAKKTLPDTPYSDLEGNCLANETLPSLAFGMKGCSIKWKTGPQEAYLTGAKSGPNKREPHPTWIETQAKGERILKLIGYDSGAADIRRSANLASSDENFDYAYPLQIIGWKRKDCVKAITQMLGPDYVPIKSACFFCPASKHWELYWLAGTQPDLFERALRMEWIAMTGKNNRFPAQDFGASWEQLVRTADRFPKLSAKLPDGTKRTQPTLGLGRNFSWNQWARVNGVVDENFKVRRHECGKFLALSNQLGGGEDNALDRRACA